MNDLKYTELRPKVAKMAKDLVSQAKLKLGVDLLITEAFRSIERQNQLYAQGRTTQGHIVTNAKGGDSIHQYRCAFDVCPLVGGKLAWNYDFSKIGAIGTQLGLEWGGNWTTFKDMPHFQFTAGYTLQDFKNGKIDDSKFAVETLSVNKNNIMVKFIKFFDSNTRTVETFFVNEMVLKTTGEEFQFETPEEALEKSTEEVLVFWDKQFAGQGKLME